MSDVLLSQLAHVEIFSPKPQESVNWFVRCVGAPGDGARGPVGVPARLGRVGMMESFPPTQEAKEQMDESGLFAGS